MTSTIRAAVFLGTLTMASVIGIVGVAVAQDDQDADFAPLIDCEQSLPAGKQYTMSIRLEIDTRSDEESTLSATLLDDEDRGSMEIPEGTDEFFRCVLAKLGIPGDAF